MNKSISPADLFRTGQWSLPFSANAKRRTFLSILMFTGIPHGIETSLYKWGACEEEYLLAASTFDVFSSIGEDLLRWLPWNDTQRKVCHLGHLNKDIGWRRNTTTIISSQLTKQRGVTTTVGLSSIYNLLVLDMRVMRPSCEEKSNKWTSQQPHWSNNK